MTSGYAPVERGEADDVITMKFGGTSVADRACHERVAALVGAVDEPTMVVVSALAGTTDSLLRAGRLAEQGDVESALAEADAVRTRHLVAAEGTDLAPALDAILSELRGLLEGVSLLREQTSRSRAMLASFGERLSAPLVAARLQEAGHPAVAVDARELLVTDEVYESGAVQLDVSTERARARLQPMLERGLTPVVTGFLGATPSGVTTVLGRGGSDYTAALLGSMLDAREIWIWTDVDGILTADPRLVRDARVLDRVSYREAAEMSYFGAKVVHPKTMLPAMDKAIPLRIRSTFHPEHPGTLIAADAPAVEQGVKTVTSIRGQVLITLEGRGMAGLPGVARRIFGVTERVGANVVMISQASSEQTVSFVVKETDSPPLVGMLRSEFELEIAAGLLQPVRVRDSVAVVSIIGQGMAGRPGTSARLFHALGHTAVNVLAIAQGASEMNISVAIEEADAGRAVRAVHSAFGLRRRVEVVLLGAGRVGAALLEMLRHTRAQLGRSRNQELRLLGVANSRGYLLDAHGLDPADALSRLSEVTAWTTPEAFAAHIDEARSAEVIVVDVSAAELVETHRVLLESGFHVVTANKKPLSGSLASYQGLVQAVRRTGARYGYETTFGAGLPVLHTLKELLHTGDALDQVSGCFSGTLGYICTRLQDGAELADIVKEAAELGYTEPDPRDDLSGMDVARKALIVARAMGLGLEPSDVRLRPMVPDMDEGLDLAIARHGGALEERVREAARRGEVLRYVASITPTEVEVGLESVPADSPIGRLSGPDNILVFRTARYRDYPLIIQGPGAGAQVTAAGVLGDVIRVASEG